MSWATSCVGGVKFHDAVRRRIRGTAEWRFDQLLPTTCKPILRREPAAYLSASFSPFSLSSPKPNDCTAGSPRPSGEKGEFFRFASSSSDLTGSSPSGSSTGRHGAGASPCVNGGGTVTVSATRCVA